LIEVVVALDHNLELAAGEGAQASGMLGAERDDERLARDAERVGDSEDSLDFLECNGFQQS